MSKYKILWIDDKWEELDSFKDVCELPKHGMEIVTCKYSVDGMRLFEEHLEEWSGVILDAKVLMDKESKLDQLKGLTYSLNKIHELSHIRKIPYYIFTGQPDTRSGTAFAEEHYEHYYEKDHDEEKLIEDIKRNAEALVDIQIIHKYQEIFDSLKILGISEYTKSILIDILLPLHFSEKQSAFKPIHHYNQLRQFVEYLFRACHKVGLIPDECIPSGIVNLNQCSVYLAGKNAEKAGVRYGELGERVVPEYIEAIIRSVLDFGNVHSHTVELDSEDMLKIENILKSAQSKYLIFGLALQMCEVIVWFANYINANTDKEVNLSYCKSLFIDDEGKSKYEGKDFVIEQDEQNNFYCGQCRLSYMAAQEYKGKIVTLYEVTDNKAKSKDNYPYFAKFKLKE